MSNSARKWPGFTPLDEVVALLPETNGNDINGLGEEHVRQPSPIMWHSPEILEHGELQEWFFANNIAPNALAKRDKNEAFVKQPLPEIAAEQPDWTPAEWSARVKEFALANEADQVGIARLDQEWVFEGYEAPYDWAIMMIVVMDPECSKTAPSATMQTEAQNQYGRGTRAAFKLTGWLREHGWDGYPHGGPMAGPVVMIPPAIEAGLGELGKHGSMINRECGSSFKLACVLTNAPLVPDRPDDLGVDDFCTNCQVCSNACPVDAIYPDKQLVRGDQRWYVDFDACILYFVENYGCGACIGQCPWSRPGTGPKLAEKMAKRRARNSS